MCDLSNLYFLYSTSSSLIILFIISRATIALGFNALAVGDLQRPCRLLVIAIYCYQSVTVFVSICVVSELCQMIHINVY